MSIVAGVSAPPQKKNLLPSSPRKHRPGPCAHPHPPHSTETPPRLPGRLLPSPTLPPPPANRKIKNRTVSEYCNLCGNLQGCQKPDSEKSRKTAEKGAEWVPVKQPKNSRNTRKAVLRVFRLFFRLFFGCLTGTHLAPFSAVFRLFSMSGFRHPCRWPQRLQSE